MKLNLAPFVISLNMVVSTYLQASSETSSVYRSESPTIEEQRIDVAEKKIHGLLDSYKVYLHQFDERLNAMKHFEALLDLSQQAGAGVWRLAKQAELRSIKDDRSLYWARLKMSKAIRKKLALLNATPQQRERVFWLFELASRGQQDVMFNENDEYRVLITGFDPFFLDRNIAQSNPSGSIALSLDGQRYKVQDQAFKVEALMLPVRFDDFDRGMVENFLGDYLRNNKVDAVITISMGRSQFDLERFPGLRRSAQAPDNLNYYTGATYRQPLVPQLKNASLDGPEFVEFSLPAQAMKSVLGPYSINDNRRVVTLAGVKYPEKLSELNRSISVEGSGGGYLSNEVSYRSIRMRNLYNAQIPVGHIHTPSVGSFNSNVQRKITEQVIAMLQQVVASR